MGITASNLSFGEVNRRFYGRKLRFTAPLTRRRKAKFPTVKPPIYLPKCQIRMQLSPNLAIKSFIYKFMHNNAYLFCMKVIVMQFIAVVLSICSWAIVRIWSI